MKAIVNLDMPSFENGKCTCYSKSMKENLKILRNKIDQIDEEILKLLDERFKVVHEISKTKDQKKLNVYQPEREKRIKIRNKKISQKYRLNLSLINKLFTLIKDESKRIQKRARLSLEDKCDPQSFKSFHYREKELNMGLPILEIFKRLYYHYENVFLLESLGENSHLSRFSIVGFDPTFILKAKNNSLDLNGHKISTNNPYLILKKYLPALSVKDKSFCGGLLGYLSYDALQYFENIKLNNPKSIFPDFQFGFYEDGLIYNKRDSNLRYFYLREDRSKEIISLLNKPIHLEKLKISLEKIQPSETNFKKNVLEAKKEIQKGNSFQIVLSRLYNLNIKNGNALTFYERLRESNPSPHMFYLKFGTRELLGSSPELIMRLENGIINNFPIAGTLERGSTPAEDYILQKKLRGDQKENAEHMMLVDLGRNDLGKISEFSSICVNKLLEIKKFSHVQHLTSEISGKIQKNYDVFDTLKAVFPMGTVSGAPKIETIKIIDRLEKRSRGPYAGAVGYFSLNGNANFALMIRSLFINKHKAYIQSGAGIVYDSDPEKELNETKKKAKGLLLALDINKNLIRTS